MAGKFSSELRDRAPRMVLELRRDPSTAQGAVERVAGQLGMPAEMLRGWVKQAEVDTGLVAGTTTADADRIHQLEAEVRLLRRTNEILRIASAFFAGRSSIAG